VSQSENSHGSPGVISGHLKEDIDHWLAKFPPDRRRSAVLAALRAAQHENNGYLTKELMDGIADYIGLPPIQVYEVATFYSMFETKPVGRHHVSVCTNISCMLRGSDRIVKHLEAKLNIRMGETTPDKKFTLVEAECLGSCGTAPMMQIGDVYHENLDEAKVDTILKGLR